MDGAGCALMFMAAGGKRENIRYVPAGMVEKFVKTDPAFEQDVFLIFADVGLNLPKYAEKFEKRGQLVVLDHHKTSLHMKDREWACIRMEACGSELLRRYLNVGNLIPAEYEATCRNLATIIDDHDRWLLNDPLSMDLAAFMSFVGQADFVDRYANGRKVNDLKTDLFTPFERDVLGILIRRRDEAIVRCIKHAKVRDLFLGNRDVRVAYVISDEPNTSILLDELLKQKPDVNVAVQVMMSHNKVSLRSRGGVPDVSEIAQQFGGGGHAAASGHLLPHSLIDELIAEIHNG